MAWWSYFGQFGVDVPIWFLYNFRELSFWVHTFKNCEKNWGSPGLFRNYSAKRKQQSPLRKNRKHDKEVRTGKEMSDFIIMLNFLLCRYYWEHISRSLCWTEMIIHLVLVIIRKWRNNNHSPEEYFYVVFCKSLGSHQKVMFRTLTLAESKDIHQARQPAWLRCTGFCKIHTFTAPQAHCQKRKIDGSGSLNRKPLSSMGSAWI